LKDTKLIWVLIDQPSSALVQKLKEAIAGLKLKNYSFIVTPSNIRPINLQTLKKYLETLLEQVKQLA